MCNEAWLCKLPVSGEFVFRLKVVNVGMSGMEDSEHAFWLIDIRVSK